MKRWLSKAALVTLLAVGSSLTFYQSSEAKNTSAYLIVFRNSQIPAEIIHLLNERYPHLKTTVVQEIGTIKFEETADGEADKVMEEIKRQYAGSIEQTGPEQRMMLPKPPDDTKVSPDQYMRKEMAFQDNSISQLSGTNLQRAEFYQQFGWDIKKITGDGQSFFKEKGSHRVRIAVIDSGIDFNHPDLKANIVSKGRSFIPQVDNTEDHLGHGTMAAGTIAANGKLLGVGPELGIIPYKVMENWEDGAESTWVTQAIIQATKDGADVINVSLGTYKSLRNREDRAVVEAYRRAVQFAFSRGAIVVASAGNEGLDLSNPKEVAEKRGFPGDAQMHFPGGGVPNVISVSATNKADQLAFYSNYGEPITLTAPGGDYGPDYLTRKMIDPRYMVLTLYPTNLELPILNTILGIPNGYTLSAGTSLAVPKVTGAVGVLIAHQQAIGKGRLNLRMINKLLKGSAIDLGVKGSDPTFGYGLVDVNKALDLLDSHKLDDENQRHGKDQEK